MGYAPAASDAADFCRVDRVPPEGDIRLRFLLRTLLAAAVAASMTLPLTGDAADEVNLYSARKEELIKPLLDRFTEQTGTRVNLVTGGADALLKRLQSEGINSPAESIR